VIHVLLVGRVSVLGTHQLHRHRPRDLRFRFDFRVDPGCRPDLYWIYASMVEVFETWREFLTISRLYISVCDSHT
jgi:hypothetical protein